ncbi:unnamed protein product [Meganyctiphanes norvegica]|uniref:Tetraspanin n=1 Tax=Meganyctiphanes norvegica TaxID=48144 RepID=A0AAV2RS46_MEGNR
MRIVKMGSGGAATGCGQFLRCLIVAVNLLLLLVSLGLVIAISFCFTVAWNASQMAPDLSMTGVLGLALAVPVLAMFISFLGCCGAWKENKCMLITYCIIIGILVALFGVAFVLMLVYKSKLPKLHDKISKELKDSLTEDDPAVMEAWNNTQSLLHCCGVDSNRDWILAGKETPVSCYEGGNRKGKLYRPGCYDLITDAIVYFTPIIIGCIITLIVFMIISICAAGTLVKSISAYNEFV